MVKQTLIIWHRKKEKKEKETKKCFNELITIFIATCQVEIYMHMEWGMVFESIHYHTRIHNNINRLSVYMLS